MYTQLTLNDLDALAEWASATLEPSSTVFCADFAVAFAGRHIDLTDRVGSIRDRRVRRAIRKLVTPAIVAFQAACLRGDV